MKLKIDKKAMGVLALVFGILILIRPDVLSWLVGLYLIIYGALELIEK
jgi:uncharacterized membrane protein HdeD (DUF308 family)